MVWQLIATIIAVALTAASYYQQKKMKKAAAKQAQDMAAVQISGHDANRALYTVYGETLVGSTIVWKGVSRWRVGMNATGFVNKTLATGSTLTANDQEGAARYLYRLASLCSGPIESVENIIIDGESYSASRFSQDSDYKHFASAISYGPTAGQAFTNLSSYGLALDSTMKGKGVAYSVERLYLHKKYPAYQGEPSTTYVIKGRKVYDPRKDSTSSYYDSSLGVSTHRIDTASTWQWSDNPAICLLDYLRSTEYGRGLSTSVIDLESIVNAADACDVSVSIPSKLTNDSGDTITYYDPFTGAEYTVSVDAAYDTYRDYQTSNTQKRFRLNIALDGADEVLDNVQKLLNCFKGHLIYANGKYRVTVEDVASSVLSLDDDDIIGGLKISDGDRSQRINRCTVKFLNANKQFKTDQVSWPELTDSQYTTYLNEDQDEKLHRTFTVEGCTDYYQAEDMAEFLVRDSRTALTVTGTFGSRALGLVPGDVISLTYDSAAYSGKYFRITQVGIDPVSMNVNLQMREYDSSVYTWNSSRGNEPLGISWALDDPINAIPDSVTFGTISSSTITKTDGSTSIRVSVPFSANVPQASYLEVSWSVQNQDEWTTNLIFDADATGTAVFTVDADNTVYDIRMRYFVTNNHGTLLPSAYTTTTYTVGQLTGTKLDGIEDGATQNTGALADLDTVGTAQIDNDAVTIAKIDSTLQSTNYSQGQTGWKIAKSGAVEFQEATITGAITATSGSIANSVTIGGTAASTVESGANAGSTALQDADTGVNLGLDDGSIGGITIASSGIYSGSHSSFGSTSQGFFIGSDGTMDFADGSQTTLEVDSSGNLTVTGAVNATSGTFTGSIAAGSGTSVTIVGDSSYPIYSGDVYEGNSASNDPDPLAASFRVSSDGTVFAKKIDIRDSDGNPLLSSADGIGAALLSQISFSSGAGVDSVSGTVSGDAGSFALTTTSSSVALVISTKVAIKDNSIGTLALTGQDSTEALAKERLIGGSNYNGAKIRISFEVDGSVTDTHDITFVDYDNLGSGEPTSTQIAVNANYVAGSFNKYLTSLMDIGGAIEYIANTGYTGAYGSTAYALVTSKTLTAVSAGSHTIKIKFALLDKVTNSAITSTTYTGTGIYYTGQTSGTLGNGQARRLYELTDANTINFQESAANTFSEAGSSVLTSGGTVSGDLVVTGNLTVSGDTITANVGTLDVEDKNITLNYSTGDSSATADGAGITIQDAVNSTTDASLTWNGTNDRWEFSHQAKMPSLMVGDKERIDVDGDLNNIRNANISGTLTSAGTATATFSGALTWSGGGSANANTAYTYSQVGHLPLAGGTMTGTLNAPDINVTNGLTFNSSGVRLKTQKTISLTSFSSSNFYPVVLTNSGNTTSTHHFVISQSSQSGGDPYNNNMIVGWARGQGWSDMTTAWDLHYNNYQDNERTILGMYRGIATSNVIIFYLRGGETYYFYTESDATVYASGYNTGTSSTSLTVAMVKDSNGDDITGQSDSSQNLALIADIFNGDQGWFTSHSTYNYGATFTGGLTWSGGSSTNANTAYTYSQVGHLPLAGGTLTGSLTGTSATFSGDITIADELLISRSSADTRKIVLYDAGLGNNYQFYGFGVESASFINNIYATTDTFYWYAGVDSTSRSLAMSLSGTGNATFTGSITSEASLTVDSSDAEIGLFKSSNISTRIKIQSTYTTNSSSNLAYIDLETGNSGRGYFIKNGYGTANNLPSNSLYIWNSNASEISLVTNSTIATRFALTSGYSATKYQNTSLGSTFASGASSGEGQGFRVVKSYVAGDFVSLIEAPYSSTTNADVRIAAKFTSSGSSIHFGTSDDYGHITHEPLAVDFANNVYAKQIVGGIDGDQFVVPVDEDTGYTNHSFGGLGILQRNAYDSYITSNSYYYKTSGSTSWRNKYANRHAAHLAFDDGLLAWKVTASKPTTASAVVYPAEVFTVTASGAVTAKDTITADDADIFIDDSLAGGNTSAYSSANRLRFSTSHTDVARGPNKITMYDASTWKGGFGIHSGTVSYYSGDAHVWYKMTGNTTSDITQRMSLDTNGVFRLSPNSNISMNSSGAGQFQIEGSGYTGAIALDGNAMHIYHNSSGRDLVLGTNETARLTIDGNGGNTTLGTNLVIGSNLYLGSTASGSYVGANGVDLEARADGAFKVYTWNTSWGERLSIGDNLATFYSPITSQAASTADDARVERWIYPGYESLYRLDMHQRVTNSVVRYSFGQTNNGSTYDDILVFDRGKLGVKTQNPAYQVDVVGTTRIKASANSYPNGALILEENTTTSPASTYLTNVAGTLYISNNSGVDQFYMYSNGRVVLKNANGPKSHAMLNIGSSGSGETRAIDIDGGWNSGESKSISFTHGSSTADLVGQIRSTYESPGSSIKFGRLYHSGNSSAYPFSIYSTSQTAVRVEVDGVLQVDSPTSGASAANRAFQASTSTKGALHVTGAINGSNGSADTVPLVSAAGYLVDQIQAGIYLSQNTSTGTSIAIFCTDNYGSGPKQTLSCLDNGIVQVNRGDLQVVGNVTAYYSDERLKIKIGGIENALDKIKSLDGFRYTANELAQEKAHAPSTPQLGLSAQQVKKIAPEVVTLAPFDIDPSSDEEKSISGENYLTVDYSRLVPILVEAIKEADQKIEAQQKQIDQLIGLIGEMKDGDH